MTIDSRRDRLFMYPKDEYGNFTGQTYCVILRNGRMYEGSAMCSQQDQFNRKIGRELAFQRAYETFERHQKFLDESNFTI